MMKLSEAILLGSVGTPQAFGDYVNNSGGTCALGAALLAVGKLARTELDNHNACSASWQWPMKVLADCPCSCGRNSYRVSTLIPHLNDVHKWTRPQIAAWVASIEPADDPVPVPEQETVNACSRSEATVSPTSQS